MPKKNKENREYRSNEEKGYNLGKTEIQKSKDFRENLEYLESKENKLNNVEKSKRKKEENYE